jgi:penicillin-insensitive murein endopeptidase
MRHHRPAKAIMLGAALLLLSAAAHAEGEPMAGLPPTPTPAPANTGALPEAPPKPAGPPDRRIAKQVFGAAATPANLAARSIGFYSRGCLAGARMLPVDGPAWQAMRLSRNRNWGHPELVKLVERLAKDAQAMDGWPGLLVGDMAQPRGGPMKTGHASHQIGLDADIWLTPMPSHRLSEKEREDLSATSMLGADNLTVNPAVWTEGHVRLLRRAALYPEVERILVHPGIKKALCDAVPKDRGWLRKVRPYWGHHYHFHVRLTCPAGSTGCLAQPAPPEDDGCGKELDDWFKLLTAPPKPEKPEKPKPPMTVDQLPLECRAVLAAKEPAVAGAPGRSGKQ